MRASGSIKAVAAMRICWSVLVSVILLISSCHTSDVIQGFDGAAGAAAAVLQPGDDDFTSSGDGVLSQSELDYLLESLGPGVAQLDSIAQNANQLAEQFPKLSATQRRFAVHPGFRSFYDSSFRREEGIRK